MTVADLATVPARLIDTLGVPATFTVAKTSVATAIPRVGLATIGRNDDAIIQAYGIGAKVITVKVGDLAAAPIKFDRFTIGGEVYVTEAAHPIHAPATGAVIAYKCFARGK